MKLVSSCMPSLFDPSRMLFMVSRITICVNGTESEIGMGSGVFPKTAVSAVRDKKKIQAILLTVLKHAVMVVIVLLVNLAAAM